MTVRRLFDPYNEQDPRIGSLWERTRRSTSERTVTILRKLQGSRGVRYLVEGTESGRQWTVSHATLIDTYEPKL